MIARYTTPEMAQLWSEETKFRQWLEVELASCEAWVKQGIIPKDEYRCLQQKLANYQPDLERIQAIEKETKHDVIAFTRAISELLGPEKRWFHYGLTSTDVVDTALALRLKSVNEVLEKSILGFLNILKQQALAFQNTPCIGRTHGVHADITSFGLKWALWYDALARCLKHFQQARSEIEVGKMSGAVGNFANLPLEIQDDVSEKLGLKSAAISTQIVNRDRHAHYMASITNIANVLEEMALEIRHLQRTEVREVQENFSSGQKGSSAMPHKRNPIASENICGGARMMRGYLTSIQENVALWHERDISHSSVERVVLMDATTLLHYMLERYQKVLANLQVNTEKMRLNIERTNGCVYTQQVLHRLIEAGATREDAYDKLQKLASLAWDNSEDEKFHLRKLLLDNDWITQNLTNDQIEECFALAPFLSRIPEIYKRVFA